MELEKINYSELNQYLVGTVLVKTPSGVENGHYGTFPAKCVEVIHKSEENVEPLPAIPRSNAYICNNYCYLCRNGMIRGHVGKKLISCKSRRSLYLAECCKDGCGEKFIGDSFYGLSRYDLEGRIEKFEYVNQAIKSENLDKTLKEMKIDSDLCALLLHYQTHDDYKNPEIDFSDMFKFIQGGPG